jgi:hypothetical protein
MKIGRYLYARLTAHAPLAALVVTRIYPVFMPQNAEYPCIVYLTENVPHDRTKTSPGTYDRAKVTLHIWQEAREGQNAYDVLDEIDAAVREALDYADTTTSGGVTAEISEYEGSRDGRDEAMITYLREATYNIVHRK